MTAHRGGRIRADDARRRADAIRSDRIALSAGVTRLVASSGTELTASSGASAASGRGFFARLIGAGPIYDLVEVEGDGTLTGWRDKVGGRSGSGWEVEDKTGLDGKRAYIPNRPGDAYRFRFHRMQGGDACHGASRVAVCLTCGCCGTAGATITINWSGGSATCTTTAVGTGGQSCCTITLPDDLPLGTSVTVVVDSPFGMQTRTIASVCGTASVLFRLDAPAFPDLHLSFTGPEALTGSTVPVEFTLHYDPASSDPTNGLYVFTTGCMPGQGGWGEAYDNFLHQTICYVESAFYGPGPCLFPDYYTPDRVTGKIFYKSTRVTATIQPGRHGGCDFGVVYRNYWNSGCPGFDPAPVLGRWWDGRLARALSQWYCHEADCPCGLGGDSPDGVILADPFYSSYAGFTANVTPQSCVCWPCPRALDVPGVGSTDSNIGQSCPNVCTSELTL